MTYLMTHTETGTYKEGDRQRPKETETDIET